MSTGMFEGLEGLGLRSDAPGARAGEAYTPGERGYDPTLVKGLFEEFIQRLSQRPTYTEGWWKGLSDERAHQLGSLPGLDGQAFLDSLVMELAWHAGEYLSSETRLLLTPCINTLSALGHHELYLDARGFLSGDSYSHEEVGQLVRGTEGQVIKLACDVPETPGGSTTLRVGSECRYVSMDVRGTMHHLGMSARHSEFTARGFVYILGFNALKCVFRLPDIEPCQRPVLMNRPTIGRSYLMQAKLRPMELQTEFWDRGNSLLVPDGKGGWTEVLP